MKKKVSFVLIIFLLCNFVVKAEIVEQELKGPVPEIHLLTLPTEVWEHSGMVVATVLDSADFLIDSAWLASEHPVRLSQSGAIARSRHLCSGLDTMFLKIGNDTIILSFFIDEKSEPDVLVETTTTPWCMSVGFAVVSLEDYLSIDFVMVDNYDIQFFPDDYCEPVLVFALSAGEHILHVNKGHWVEDVVVEINSTDKVEMTSVDVVQDPTCDDAVDGIILLSINGSGSIERWEEESMLDEKPFYFQVEIDSIGVGVADFLILDEDGCATKSSFETYPKGKDCLEVYDFSPNGDGHNDFFTIDAPESAIVSVTISKLSGEIIFQSSNYQNDWNGENLTGHFAVSVVMTFDGRTYSKNEIITIN